MVPNPPRIHSLFTVSMAAFMCCGPLVGCGQPVVEVGKMNAVGTRRGDAGKKERKA